MKRRLAFKGYMETNAKNTAKFLKRPHGKPKYVHV
jgi:hypothetical protein